MTNRIARQSYQRIRQADLASFTENVIKRTQAAPEYAFLKTEVDVLSAALPPFAAALAAARNRGLLEVAIKNVAKKTLLSALDKTADALERQSEDAMLLMGAGFLLQEPSVRFKGNLDAPEVRRVQSTGRKGELRIQLSDTFPAAVVTHAMEYSEDQGASWKNGIYHTYSYFVVDHLPASTELWLRFKSVGRANSKSNWSATVIASVL